MEKKEQEVAEEYLSSLADLNLNSKPLINMLTILAEENIEHAAVIVKAVEQHIAKVSPDVKLPVLYLIDSIVKNVGREYIPLFSHCIVNIFCGVFEKVNEKIREKMYTLRQTWNDVFTPQKLYTLDVKVNCMDPNWPITAKVLPKSPAIHVNPIFLKKGEPINDMQAKLRDKQRQLLELQKRKLELELAATKQRLEEQEKQLNMQTESVKPVQGSGSVPSSTGRSSTITAKSGPQRPLQSIGVSTAVSGINNQPCKTRVAPVSPAILNSIRQRDPRLARQQHSPPQPPSNVDESSVSTISSTLPKVTTSDDRSSLPSLSTVTIESKSGNENSDKFLHKFIHTKHLYGSSKERHRSSSSSSSNKKSSTKSTSHKISSSNDGKSVSRLSSSRTKIQRIGSTKGGSSSNSKSKEKESRPKSHTNEKRVGNKSEQQRGTLEETAAKLNEKSTKKLQDYQKLSESQEKSPVRPKFKDFKEITKSRNYMRRNREKSISPIKSCLEDADMRPPIPDKKLKVDDLTISNKKADSNDDQSSTEVHAPAIVEEKVAQSLEQNVEAVSCMDVDLRQFQTNISQSSSLPKPNDIGKVGLGTGIIDMKVMSPKKRLSIECNEEPTAKKSRSEELDPLFGSEDVDLRKLNTIASVGPVSSTLPMTPPPPPIISKENESWAMVKGTQNNFVPSKSNLDDVRAKLAKATRNIHRKKNDGRFNELQRGDFAETNEDSEDGTDAKIRTIISQAQELLDTENMNADQYNVLVKTVIQISETNKLKEAQRRESLLFKSNNLEDLTPISDEEVKFSSDDESENDNKKQVRCRKGQKSIKSDRKDAELEKTNLLQKSAAAGNNGNAYVDVRPKGSDKRSRISKWTSPWETGNNGGAQKGWLQGNNNRPLFPSKIGAHNQTQIMTHIPNRINVPNPWQNPPPMIFPPPIPIPVMSVPGHETKLTPVVLPQRLSNSVDNPNSDVLRTVTIDKMQKEIRFYDEVPIAFMEWDQPKQIGFQNGQRRITIDDRDSIILNFNDDYKSVSIDGKIHKIRFGCPTRELFIDNDWFECYFGDPPVGILLDGRVRVFKIEGPPPQLLIGNLRQDLVVGKINLIIDARIIVPVFLDAKAQTFEVDGTKHTLQFADYLKTVLIDNEPMSVEYGGLPKSIMLNGVKHFIRFGTLPNGVIPGKVLIKNMIRTEFCEKVDSPTVVPSEDINVCMSSSSPQLNELTSTSSQAQQSALLSNETPDCKTAENEVAPIPGSINIDELFQKLLATGILNQDAKRNKPGDDSSSKIPKEKDIVKPVDLSKPETIKMRQLGVVQKLYFGMQCSSCGVRFPPEQTMKYSQHLDWHFRQNRRERDSARKAHSRKWYYDVSDWIQYEEIEDLDEREKNWFETQQNELENFEENSNPRVGSPQPSCPAGPEDVDKACDMCHDKFEQFYDEESEEWHLRSAIRIDDKIYHPVCYEDYKASLKFEESNTEAVIDDNAVDNVIVKTEKQVDDKTEGDKECDDDDDVIVVPNDEPSITEIVDDDEDENSEIPNISMEGDAKTENTEKGSNNSNTKNNDSMESDVEIQEPNIPFTDLDTYEEVPPGSVLTLDDSSQSSQINQVKIKEEPKYDGYDDDAFEDVGTFVCVDDLSQTNEEYASPSVISNPHEAVKPSIDGNLEIGEAAASTVGVTKIKINITKNISSSSQNTSVNTAGNTSPVTNSDSSANGQLNNLVENIVDKQTNENVSCINDKNELDSVGNVCNSEIIFKPEMQGIDFREMPVCKSGYETSGLCSIM